MFDPRNPRNNPHRPCPSGFRCGLLFARDHNVEKAAKRLLQQTVLSTNRSLLDYNLGQLKLEFGDAFYDALMKNNSRMIFLDQLDYLAACETIYGEWTSNIVETNNHSHGDVRDLDPVQGVVETLDKAEKKNNNLLRAALKELKDGFRVSAHARMKLAALALKVQEFWKVKEVSRLQINPHASIHVKLCRHQQPTVTKLVCIDLDPTLQYWYERCNVHGDYGSRLYGMPCKFCSYVLFFMSRIIVDHYQQNAVKKDQRLSRDELTKLTRDKDFFHVDNPQFYEALFHLELIVEAYSNLPVLVSDFDPEQEPKYLITYQQGQINKQKSRFKKGVLPYAARKAQETQLQTDMEQRQLLADTACSQREVGSVAPYDNSSELSQLLLKRSNHANETDNHGFFDCLNSDSNSCKL
jgi:hypothetical protein